MTSIRIGLRIIEMNYNYIGGDDKRVLIWNVHQAIVSVQRTTPKPIVLQAAHRSNVFALAFVSSQQKIISAGNDEQVIVHDIHT